MESSQINEPELRKLETLQLNALRKLLKPNTTYVNRENTNTNIYKEVDTSKLAEIPANVQNHMKPKK